MITDLYNKYETRQLPERNIQAHSIMKIKNCNRHYIK